ncbi:MAG: helix-turn-helix domain-containing protein [Pyrinomonadaceae bacterium]|nr:helix-turn-helix domain-containing protein [Phycisphaerales bacterium]
MTDRASNPITVPGTDQGAGCEPSSASKVPPPHSWFTPREVAKQRRVRVEKVMTWIRSGELEAVNHASSTLAAPRWKISVESLARFDGARSSRLLVSVSSRRTRRGKGIEVKEFFR